MKKGVVFERSSRVGRSHVVRKDNGVLNKTQGRRSVAGSFSDVAKFDSLVRGCRRKLLQVSAFFPLDLFPDMIIIDECKVSIIFRVFFFSEDIHSINIEMIRDVDVETGPFFASLKIVPDGYPGRPLVVRYLKKRDANLARSVIQGLMVVKRNNIDLGNIDAPDLVDKLEALGRTHVT